MAKNKADYINEINGILAEITPVLPEMGLPQDDYIVMPDYKVKELKEALTWLKNVVETQEYQEFDRFGRYFDYVKRMPAMRSVCNTDLREYRDATRILTALKRILSDMRRPEMFNAQLRSLR